MAPPKAKGTSGVELRAFNINRMKLHSLASLQLLGLPTTNVMSV